MSKVLHSIGVILGMSYAVADEPGELESLGITGDGAKGFRAMASGQSATLRRMMTDLAVEAAKSSNNAVLVDLESFASGAIEGMERSHALLEKEKEPTPAEMASAKQSVVDVIKKMMEG